MYSIGALAKLSNTTVRTLRYYDEIGLLKPSKLSEGSHRYYGEEAIEKLHNIITLKELGFELETIKQIVAEEVKSSKELLHWRIELLHAKQTKITKQKEKIYSLLRMMELEGKNDWQTIFDTLATIKNYDQEKIIKSWNKYFTPKEQQIMDALPKLGEDTPLANKWIALLKETKEHLHLDTTSNKGQQLAKKWLNIVYISYQGDWKLAEKVWDISLDKNDNIGFYPMEPEVVDFIHKAQSHFFEQHMDSVHQVIDYE